MNNKKTMDEHDRGIIQAIMAGIWTNGRLGGDGGEVIIKALEEIEKRFKLIKK